MVICVDASVAWKWLFEEDRCEAARALLVAAQTGVDRLIAPALFRFELTNALRQRVRGGLPIDHAEAMMHDILVAPVIFVGFDAIHPRALAISHAFDLAAAYDAHYVALAELVGCDLWTDDQGLVRSLHQAMPFVRWLGDFQ